MMAVPPFSAVRDFYSGIIVNELLGIVIGILTERGAV